MTEQTDRNKATAIAFYELMFNEGRPRDARLRQRGLANFGLAGHGAFA